MKVRDIFLPLLLLCLLAVPAQAVETDAPDWGLTMELEDVTPTGATVVFTQSGGSPTGELETGAPYWIETQRNGQWVPLEIGDVAWIMPAYRIPEGGSRTFPETWSGLYGELPPGVYRLGKEVMDFRGTGDYDQHTFYAEFSIGLLPPFTDVYLDDWFVGAVEYVHDQGLMQGKTADTFAPYAVTTRGQILTILWRMAGTPEVRYLLPFSDVPQDLYCAEAIRWAASQGIASGFDDGTFRPDTPITREQLAVFLWRYAGKPVTAGPDLSLYADGAAVNSYAVSALEWACGSGILSGYLDGRLAPSATADRAQTAVMLMKYSQL